MLAFNRPVDAATAEEVAKLFVECIVAPGYADGALEILRRRKICGCSSCRRAAWSRDRELELKRILGGVLVQEPDLGEIKEKRTEGGDEARARRAEELRTMLFGWKVCKHVKSNAIVFAKDGATVGVGAGQMSRVDSVKIAVMKAQMPLGGKRGGFRRVFSVSRWSGGSGQGRRDGGDSAGRLGARRDVIAAADRLGMAMVFTGVRHFRH